jgi:hypothetical protein
MGSEFEVWNVEAVQGFINKIMNIQVPEMKVLS